MSKEKKDEIVTRLEDMLSKNNVLIFTDYRGMSVSELTQLRGKLRDRRVEFHVVKNSLTHLAAERAGKDQISSLLQGPTAIAFSYGEVTDPAKALIEHIRSTKSSLSIKGGLIDERLFRPEEVMRLAILPSKDVLFAQLLGGLQSPILSLQYVLSANLRKLVTVLQARAQQLEGGI